MENKNELAEFLYDRTYNNPPISKQEIKDLLIEFEDKLKEAGE